MSSRLLVVASALAVTIGVWAMWTSVPDGAAAVGAVQEGAIGVAPVLAQAEEAPAEDDRVPVQVWTVVAAAGAALVGLLGFAIRWKLGRVAPPPEQPAEHGGEH